MNAWKPWTPQPTDEWFLKATAYVAKHTAHLPTTQGLGTELAIYLALADAAALRGDVEECKAQLHTWMAQWLAISKAAKAA